MGEWSATTIGKVTSLVTKGTTPPKGKGFVDVGVNYIKSDSLSYDRPIDTSLFVAIDYETHRLFKRSQIEASDILFSMAGAFLGKSGMAEASMLPANTNQAVAIIRPDQNIVEPLFLGLFFRQKSIIEFVNNLSGQSAQPNINFQEIKSIELMLPELPEQRAIASVLSSLDAKIDLLHRQNKTLEAMAETLFRQWFVERRPEALEGEAEEGWEQRPLSSIANYLNGVACQKYPAKDPVNRLPVLKIKELGSGITDSSDWATSTIDPKYHVVAGDVVFSWSAKIMVKLWDGPKAVLNQHLFKVTSEEFPKWFYFMWTKHHVDEFVSIAESHATTFGHIKRGDLDEAMVRVPAPERLKEMSLVMDPLFEKHIINSTQIKSLTALRDTLLPKLMSGEVRVQHQEALSR